MVRWKLTEKGKDTLPILMQLVMFGSKWYSVVFEDKEPRKVTDTFPQPKAREIITNFYLSLQQIRLLYSFYLAIFDWSQKISYSSMIQR